MEGEEGKLPAAPVKTEGLQSSGPAPFLNKTYDIVDDNSTDLVVSWSSRGESFIVWKSDEFENDLLPKYFKHSKLPSFVRQLNIYGFRKVDPDRWEFANKAFVRGQRHLLKDICRRKSVSHHQAPLHQTLGPCVEVEKFRPKVEMLKRDKNVLMLESVRLRLQQVAYEQELQGIWQRFQVAEQREQEMMWLLSKALHDPVDFLPQQVQRTKENDLSTHYSGVMHTDMQVCAPEPTSMPMGETPTDLHFHPSSLAEAPRRFEGHSIRPLTDLILRDPSTAEPTPDVYAPVPGHSSDSEGLNFGETDPWLEFPENPLSNPFNCHVPGYVCFAFYVYDLEKTAWIDRQASY